MIPNRIHFIFGLHPTFGEKPFSMVHYLSILSAFKVNNPDEIVLHYAYEPKGEWWERTRPLVQLNRVTVPEAIHGRALTHFAHKADVLRLQLLSTEGGIYLDADTFCISPFRPLFDSSTVMGIEPNAGLCNAVILAEKAAPFLTLWLEHYRTFTDEDWRSHSVIAPYRISKRHPELVRIENEYAFFFPSYDDPMRRLLWDAEVSIPRRIVGLARIVRDIPYYSRGDWPVRYSTYIRHLLLSRAAFFAKLRQSYCLHLWESLWWNAHLRDMSAASLAQSKGVFADLVVDVLGTILLGE